VTPGNDRGCCHCSELSVLFQDPNLFGNPNTPEGRRVGHRMRQIWGEFARHGTCAWEKRTAFIIA